MNRVLLAAICITFLMFTGCSTVNIVKTWKADNAPTIKAKNTLVIARTNNKEARIAFEEAIAAKLRKKGIQATESYKRIPELQPDRKLSEAELEQAKDLLRKASFNGVVITVLKDKKTVLHGGYDQAHYAGDTYGKYYLGYYGDFYGYYNHPSSYLATDGVEVKESFDIQEAITYVLETLAYNLDEPVEKQLVATVVADIEEPASIAKIAKPYANKIIKSLKQN